MEPGGKEPAPGELRLVQEFVNTNDLEEGEDELAGPEALAAWLHGHGILLDGSTLTEADLQKALEVREALRALALANNGGELDPRATEVLNRAGERSGLLIRFRADGPSRLEPRAGGVDGALGLLLARVHTAMADGAWERLKACRNDVCRWVFYDHSKNRSGAWCSMAECGDKIKARAYRRRRRSGE